MLRWFLLGWLHSSTDVLEEAWLVEQVIRKTGQILATSIMQSTLSPRPYQGLGLFVAVGLGGFRGGTCECSPVRESHCWGPAWPQILLQSPFPYAAWFHSKIFQQFIFFYQKNICNSFVTFLPAIGVITRSSFWQFDESNLSRYYLNCNALITSEFEFLYFFYFLFFYIGEC